MHLGAPAFLYALLLMIPVLIAFLVRKRRSVLRVPSTMVWRLGARSVAKSRRIRDVRRWLALAACLAAVAALAVAAARPTGRASGLHVYVVDVSSSMAGAPLDGARRFLVREVSGLGPDARVAIVRAGAEPRVVLPPSPPGPLVDNAIAALTAEHDAASMEQAVALGEGLARGNGRVVILSDEAIDADVSRFEHKPELRVFARGARPDNLGITSLFSRTAVEARDDEERDASVSIASSSSTGRRAKLTVTFAGRVVAERRLDVPPQGEITEHVTIRGAGRLVARVSADDGKSDAIAIDDEASLEEVARRPPRVAFLSPHPPELDPDRGAVTTRGRAAAFFLEKAMRAAGVKDIVDVDPAGKAPAGVDVVVVLEDGPARPRNVPAFFVQAKPDDVTHTKQLTADESHVRSIATDDPLMRGVVLDGLTTFGAEVPVKAPGGSRSLVELDGGPVMLAGGSGDHAWVWLGIDPEASDLVLRVAFPVMVANVLTSLGAPAQTIVARTAPGSEVTLVAHAAAAPLPAAAEPRWRVPATPALLLALAGAFLLGLEAWLTFRRKWAW